MSSFWKRYVRLSGADTTIRLEEAVRPATLEAKGETFAAFAAPDPHFEPDNLAALSREFGEAISLQVHPVADMVVYDHFRDGDRVRGLTYAGEAGWVRVQGTPEPWEAPLFFSSAALEELLLELEDDVTDDALRESEENELRGLWEARELVEGKTRPSVNGKAFQATLVRAFGLPVTAANGKR